MNKYAVKNILNAGYIGLKIRGYNTVKYHKQLMESQWYTPSELEEIQEQKLRILLDHAYKNVPYYTKLFDNLKLKPSDIKDKEDLNKLPLLRKEEIRKNLPALIPRNYKKKDLMPMSSSGTTGEPLKLFKDRNRSAWRAAARHRTQKTQDYEQGDRIATIYGYSFPRRIFTKRFILDKLKNEWVPSGASTSDKKIKCFINKLERFNPDFIRAWPSSVYPIAEYAEDNELNLNLKNIWLHGEVLFKYQKEYIEKQMNCDIFDLFGLRESSVYSFECHEQTGYHLDAENGIIEIIRNGKHVSEGELGATVFTDFTNFATPLIRYVSEDVAIYSGKSCPCGRGLPLVVKSPEGRFGDCITTNGGFILPNSFADIFYDIETIKNFQVIQKTNEKILVKIKVKPDYSSEDADMIINKIQKLMGFEVDIEINLVETFPYTSSGKKRYIISEVPQDWTYDFLGTPIMQN